MPDEVTPQEEQLSDEDLQQFLASTSFAPESTEPTTPDGVGDDDGGSGDDGVQPTGDAVITPTPAESWTYDDGLTLDRQRAYELAQFDSWLRANPAQAQRLAGVVQGLYDVVPADGSGGRTHEPSRTPAPATPAIPTDIDLDDPTVKFLYNELTSTREQLTQAAETLQRHEQMIGANASTNAQSLLNKARESYMAQHKFSTDEMQQIEQTAAQLGIVDSLVRQTADPLQAIERAFDVARRNIPEFHQREVDALIQQRAADARKKGKLSSLVGTSGSIPRTESKDPRTMNPAERNAAMVAEVAGMIAGNTTQE